MVERYLKKEKWIYNDNLIEAVDSFNYLGIALNLNGKFTKNTECNCIVSCEMYGVYFTIM